MSFVVLFFIRFRDHILTSNRMTYQESPVHREMSFGLYLHSNRTSTSDNTDFRDHWHWSQIHLLLARFHNKVSVF